MPASLILPNIKIVSSSSPPVLSETCVYSMPSSSSICSQNTFISDNTLTNVSSCSNLHSLHNGKSSSEISLHHRCSSPSLRSAVLSKKCSLYKARKSSSKDLISLVSFPPESSSSSSPSATSPSSSSFSSLHENMASPTSSPLALLDSSSCLSYTSSLISEIDDDSLYSNHMTSSISTIYEINDNDHPLGMHEDLLYDQTFIIDEIKSIKHENDSNLKSIITSLKDKIVKSSFKLSTKLLSTTTKTNESFINNSINLINIQNKDLILHDNVLQLETFHTSYKEINDEFELDNHPIPTILIPKSRECRINPTFLKFFAINSSVKHDYSNQLLDNHTLDYYQYEFMNSNCTSLDEFLNNFHDSNVSESTNDLKVIIKYSLLSRDKMYSRVFLPPRNDLINNIKRKSIQNNYIKIKDEAIYNGTSLVRENSKVMPWFKLNDCGLQNKICFNPSGTLSNNTQYTVKNWENKRWSPINLEN